MILCHQASRQAGGRQAGQAGGRPEAGRGNLVEQLDKKLSSSA